MESQTILSQEQMGFRPNRQLGYSHTNNIHTSFLENVVAAAFFNITGVFDNVLPEDCFRILSETQKIGVSAKLRTFIENIITHRSVHFVEKSHLSEATLYIRELLNIRCSVRYFSTLVFARNLQLHPGTNFLQYADDIVIYSSSRQVSKKLSANLQSSLNMIYLYLSNKNLELLPIKFK